MSEIKLLPCPFCGGEAIIQVISSHTHEITKWLPDYNGEAIVECKCGCSIMRDTEEEAIKAWNTRKPIENIVKELEEWSFETEIVIPGISDGYDDTATRQIICTRNAIDIVKGSGLNE